MASYCDEFSFDEVFEDPSYVQVCVNKSSPYPLQEKDEDEDEEDEEDEDKDEEDDLDYEKIKFSKKQELFEMKLNKLEFIKESMTEEQLDHFWKEMSDSRCRYRCDNIMKIYPIRDLVQEDEEDEDEENSSKQAFDLYFHREIMTV
jgi:hypothetical protein